MAHAKSPNREQRRSRMETTDLKARVDANSDIWPVDQMDLDVEIVSQVGANNWEVVDVEPSFRRGPAPVFETVDGQTTDRIVAWSWVHYYVLEPSS